jgi:hypothetical protein
MSCLEPQPPAIQFNAITDNVYKTESLPEKGITNTGFEVVEVIDGCPGIKIGSLLGLGGENSTQSKGKIGLSSGRSDRLCSFRGGRSSLTTGQSIDFIVVAEDSDIRVSPRGVEEVISSNACQIPVSGQDDDI